MGRSSFFGLNFCKLRTNEGGIWTGVRGDVGELPPEGERTVAEYSETEKGGKGT